MSIPTTIHMPAGIEALLCTVPYTPQDHARLGPGAVRLIIKDQPYLLAQESFERGARLQVDAFLDGGAILVTQVSADLALLTPFGIDAAWLRRYERHLVQIAEMHRQQIYAENQADAARLFSESPQQEGTSLLREILGLAQAGGQRDLFKVTTDHLRSWQGAREGLWEVDSKAQLKPVRDRLSRCGVSAGMFARLSLLAQQLRGERNAYLAQRTRADDQTPVLQALLGMGFGDMAWISHVTRTEMRDSRWESYQIGVLLGLRRPAAPQKDEDDPDAPTPPGPGAGPGNDPPRPPQPQPRPPIVTGPPVQPSPEAPRPPQPPQPIVTGPPIQPSPEAPRPPQPQPIVAPPQPIAAGPAPALAGMAPGTVLYSMPAKDGPALLAVVQPDGSVAWTPAAPVPAPIAPPAPGESKAKPKAPSPKTGTRTRRRPTP